MLRGGRLACFAAVAALAAAQGCTGGRSGGSAGGKRLMVLTNVDAAFFDAVERGVDVAEEELGVAKLGFDAVLDRNNGTVEGQVEKLRQYASQSDIVGVAVSAVDANNAAIADAMRDLQKKGIRVLTFDSDVDRDQFRDARLAFIGTDNREGGITLGKAAKNLSSEGSKYITFVGYTGAQNARERIAGFQEGAGEKFTSVDSMPDQTDRQTARENVRNAMTNHPEVDMLVGVWSYNAPAIVDVVGKERKAKYKIVCFDAEEGAINAVGDGMIDTLVVQNPYEMGYQSVKLLLALATDDKQMVETMLPKGADIYDTGLKVVVPDEKSPLKADLFDKKTEFFTLGKFRDWLSERKLRCS